MLRPLLTIASIVALLYLACCVLLFSCQRSLIYYPHPPSSAQGTSTITLPAEGAEVRVTASPKPGPGAVVYFGGNAEDVNHSLPDLESAFPQHALYLMHYRGYGGSTGKPSERALVADGLALFDRVHTEHPNVVVIGRSLGSGVAIQVATSRPVSRLILVTPYNSLEELAARQYAIFPIRWLMMDKFQSWRYAPKVTAPTLLVAAENDQIVPRQSTEALYARFNAGVATLREVAGTGHNTIQESPRYIPLLQGAP
ncbi:MAG TPA: alpha/beta fold hydrolase [Thermoanaerobaculia bacterium]|jgi:pimeloyl-ACP methyl ester carboxylesterase|nr:alpha/beta fold hydrolase [Thermoanaerobaculia bacterium]